MLSKQTVFVLGAGASAPFGFSTGKKQLDEARTLTAIQLGDMIAPVPRTVAASLLAALNTTGEYSIDAMLPADSPLLPAAKALIARDLFRIEHANLKPKAEPDDWWYRTLFSNIPRGTVGEAMGAPLRIFTFNYDRSLDDFLWRAFSHRFPQASSAEIAALLDVIGPFHLHGQLGRMKPEITGAAEVVPYGGSGEHGATETDMLTAVGQIKLISETQESDEAFGRAHAEIQKAERLVFLGFAFHGNNVRKLMLKEFLRPQTVVFASAKGLTEQQTGYMKGKYGLASMATGGERDGVSRFLANLPHLLD